MIAAFLRHGSNGILALGIVAAIGAFGFGAVPFSLAGALIGAAIFFVSEYTTHRFLFHAQPSKIPFVLKLQHKLHYDHHIDPPKIELLFLPWWFVVPTVLVYYGIYLAVVRSPALAFSLSFGSVCALFYYEWVHYVAHIPFNPVTPLGRYVKKYHLWHHFKNEHFWYGVTNPSMDFVGATYRDVESVDRSTTVREIWRGM
ncbi:MAG TPA: sterol desaturase family protein [Verrucomicrobiae bacterium]|nr:sterol desaturase family protein [Verrucomicrobiae bacterium]